MWKIAIIFAISLVATSGQQQRPTRERQRETQQPPPAVTITTNESSAHYEQKDADKPQGWHKFVTWPEGIVTWAIILTLGAIVWQAVETRRSVKIATKTLVTSFRPKVIVRSIKLDPPATIFYERRKEGIWSVSINLTNTGGTEAKVKKVDALFQIYSDTGMPLDTIGTVWTPALDREFLVLPGSQHILRGVVTDGQSFYLSLHSIESSTASHNTQLRRPTCHGTITYVDGNGFERKTGFIREWKVEVQRFAVVDDPAYEYQD